MSKSILHQLYHGDIYPSETIVPPDPRYQEVQNKASTILYQLHESLTAEQFSLLENYLDSRSECSDMELSSTFAEAFKLGAQIMLEIQNRDVSQIGSISVSICGGNHHDQNHNMG
ncbi:DUF6809 family protein [Oscillospiraceae bacterium PP1C4]